MTRRPSSLQNLLFAWIAIATGVPSPVLAQTVAELQVFREEAEESLYDGRYDEAVRLSDRALDWTAVTANRKLLASIGEDWTVQEALLNCIKSTAYFQQGNEPKARATLKRAAKQLESRRTYLLQLMNGTRNGPGQAPKIVLKDPGQFWLIAAYVKINEGMLEHPVTRPGENEFGSYAKAVACYRAASDILHTQLGTRGGGAATSSDSEDIYVERAMLHVYLNLARLELWSRQNTPADKFLGVSEGQARDAQSFLIRADEGLRQNPYYNAFIAPDALFPISYKSLQDVADAKKGGPGAAGPDTLSESELIEFKQRFAHTISDFFLIMTVRAEAEAVLDHFDKRAKGENAKKPWAMDNAERCYQEALLLLRSQFRPEHPTLLDTELSKARWYAIRSNIGGNGAAVQGPELRSKLSMARDCLFLLHRIRSQHDALLTPRKQAEIDRWELVALENIELLHQNANCLDADQVKEIQARKAVLQNVIGKPNAKPNPVAANQPNPGVQ